MMASDYGPEIKASQSKPVKRPSQVKKESPADKARDVKHGIPEGGARDMKLDAMPANQAPPSMQGGGGGGHSPAHAAMAASIAHAILGKGGM